MISSNMSVQMQSRLFIDIAYEAMACSTPDMIPGVILMLESHLRNNRREGKVMCFHEKWDAFGHCLSKCKVNFWGHRVKRLPLLLAFELICMVVRVHILSIIKGCNVLRTSVAVRGICFCCFIRRFMALLYLESLAWRCLMTSDRRCAIFCAGGLKSGAVKEEKKESVRGTNKQKPAFLHTSFPIF